MNGVAGVGGAERRDFFYLDSGFQMKQRTWNGIEWTTDWFELGGIFTTVPAAVSATGVHAIQQTVIGRQPVTMAVPHEGTDSEARCGLKSEYVVTWSISASNE